MVGSIHYLEESEANITMWKESLFAIELALLHASPVYYGLGIPKGDDAAVVTIPGFLTSDYYLGHLQSWLGLIGYRPYLSGIGLNADCPNQLIERHLSETIDTALRETGRKIHLVGHSLGGVIARSICSQRPNDIASVTTIAAPFLGAIVHRNVLRAVTVVRSQVLKRRGVEVFDHCFTAKCNCDFASYLRKGVPASVAQTAIYTCDDGVVDWRCCRTGESSIDFEVPGTHIGLVVNAGVYTIIANRLAAHSTN